jgi:ribonuclease E
MPTPKVEVEEPSLPKSRIEPPLEDSKSIGFDSLTDDEEIINSTSIPNRRRRRRSSALEDS